MASDVTWAVPDHVPSDKVLDFDFYNFEVDDGECQIAMKRVLRAPGVPEVFWSPYNGGHWAVTRATQIADVLGDPTRFSSRQVTLPRQPPEANTTVPLQLDPPEHMKYRRVLASGFSPQAITPVADSARERARSLIEGFRAQGECEFISEFAQYLPIDVFMSLVDLPHSDRTFLTETGELAVRGTASEQVEGRRRIGEYGLQKVQERRAKPGTDLISTIAKAEIDSEAIDESTVAGMVQLLLLAGLDTVTSMLGFVAQFLAKNPDHRAQLMEHPALIPSAVEELMRRYPIALQPREVTRDFEYHGALLRRGDMILAPTPMDGLDEDKYENPETVDFARKVNNHLSFGGGAHRCIGAMLARAELKIFLEEWLRLIPDFRIKPGCPVRATSTPVLCISALPLVWPAG